MPKPWIPARALVSCLVLLVLAGTAATARASDEQPVRTARWYDQLVEGHKSGFLRVVWAPSTWQGKQTIHDTTMSVSRTQRNMAGMVDTFEVTTLVDLERGVDGTLWWLRVRREEPERVTLEETTWKTQEGVTGYEVTVTIVGQEESRQRLWIPLPAPVFVDAEAFLGERARSGTLQEGAAFEIRNLDVRKRGAGVSQVTVLGEETIADEEGKDARCYRILERSPESGTESTMWLDRSGAFVRIRSGSVLIQRVTEAKAEAMPTRPAVYTITLPASPPLARIYNADRVLLDVHIQADADRKLPEFPSSPWSRVLSTQGDDASGYVAKVELTRYDSEAAKARIPLVDEKFERDLEATALMQTQHPLVRQTVRDVVGEERDARQAAHKLVRFVFSRLEKRSPDVADADAVQILESCRGDCSEHCLLFVTLCRAAGIPARRCSGYVCIGGMWGAHAWCEIWTGQWIGADPTTGELGTAARYLFFGRPDEPGSFPGVVSSRVRGRLRIETTRVEEGKAAFDLSDVGGHRIADKAAGRYVHVLAGLEARDVPADWTVQLSQDNVMLIRGPGFAAQVGAWADQGDTLDTVGRYFRGEESAFAGVPALVRSTGTTRLYWLFSRRRHRRDAPGPRTRPGPDLRRAGPGLAGGRPPRQIGFPACQGGSGSRFSPRGGPADGMP